MMTASLTGIERETGYVGYFLVCRDVKELLGVDKTGSPNPQKEPAEWLDPFDLIRHMLCKGIHHGVASDAINLPQLTHVLA